MTRAKGGAVPTTNPGGIDATPSAALRPSPKPKTWRNPEYLEFLRRCPCPICLAEGKKVYGCDAAHLRTKRVHGDKWAIPLCRKHHALQHQIGITTFVKRFKVRVATWCRGYRGEFFFREPAF